MCNGEGVSEGLLVTAGVVFTTAELVAVGASVTDTESVGRGVAVGWFACFGELPNKYNAPSAAITSNNTTKKITIHRFLCDVLSTYEGCP